MASKKIFTVGYEGKSIDGFISELKLNKINVLVDVRLTPLSRKPGFAKRRLSEELLKNKIEYLHIPQLGNPKNNRDNFRATKSGNAANKFRRMMRKSSDSHLFDLLILAKKKNIALMCFENDAMCCHRTVVAEMVVEKDDLIEVVAV